MTHLPARMGLPMRQWASAALASCLLASLPLACPTTALAGSSPVPPPAPTCVPDLVANVGSQLNQVTPITGSASVTCAEPGGLPGEQTGPSGPLPQQNVPIGTKCEVIRFQPEGVIVNADGTVTEMIPDPNGQQRPFVWSQYGIILVSEAADGALFFPWEHEGRTAAGGVCVPTNNGQWENGCAGPVPVANLIGLTGLSSNQCLVIRQQPAVGPGLPPGTIGPDIIWLRDTVDGQINAGTMSSTPVPAGLVNTRTCFFVSSMNTPQNAQFQTIIPGPPDSLGRRIFYVFVITVTNSGLTWDFGDGSGDTTGVAIPPQCTGQAAGAQVSTAHVYTRYSDGQPGGAYQVRAVEHYAISVTEMWWDASPGSPHRIDVDLAALGVPPTIDKPVPAGGAAYPQRVLQEEGVPIGA